MVRLLGGVGKNIAGRCDVDKGLETGSYVVLLKKKKNKTEKTASTNKWEPCDHSWVLGASPWLQCGNDKGAEDQC